MTDSPAPTDVRAKLQADLEAIRDRKARIVYPWTHEQAADEYAAMLDRDRHNARDALAALAALPAPAPAEAGDWKLVPLEPTPEMMRVAVDKALTVALSSNYRWPEYVRDLYLTMLAAAPSHPSPDAGALRGALRNVWELVAEGMAVIEAGTKYRRDPIVGVGQKKLADALAKLAALSLKEPDDE